MLEKVVHVVTITLRKLKRPSDFGNLHCAMITKRILISDSGRRLHIVEAASSKSVTNCHFLFYINCNDVRTGRMCCTSLQNRLSPGLTEPLVCKANFGPYEVELGVMLVYNSSIAVV
jgi:hypothetical protein